MTDNRLMALRSTKQLRWTVLHNLTIIAITTARMEDDDNCDDGDFKGTIKRDRRRVKIASIGRYLVSTCDGNVNTIFNRTFERYRLRKNWRFSQKFAAVKNLLVVCRFPAQNCTS